MVIFNKGSTSGVYSGVKVTVCASADVTDEDWRGALVRFAIEAERRKHDERKSAAHPPRHRRTH